MARMRPGIGATLRYCVNGFFARNFWNEALFAERFFLIHGSDRRRRRKSDCKEKFTPGLLTVSEGRSEASVRRRVHVHDAEVRASE